MMIILMPLPVLCRRSFLQRFKLDTMIAWIRKAMVQSVVGNRLWNTIREGCTTAAILWVSVLATDTLQTELSSQVSVKNARHSCFTPSPDIRWGHLIYFALMDWSVNVVGVRPGDSAVRRMSPGFDPTWTSTIQ